MQIELSNYRAIRPEHPLVLDLSSGITFLLGRNNVGKSTVLRFFSELRPLFERKLDPRTSADFEIETALTCWDSLAHRQGVNGALVLKVTDGPSAWKYEIRHAGPSQHTNKLHVHYKPMNYANDNDVVNRAHQIFRGVLAFGPLRSTTFSGFMPALGAATGSQFVNTWAEWSAGPDIQKRAATRQLEREIQALFNFSDFKLTLNNERNELIADYDDGSFKLSELGEGLSHFIVVLANALIRQPTLILIDEPENGLHPQLQATFVQTLARKATHGLIAASHSMALARHVADTVLYCTKSDSRGFSATAHHSFAPHRLIDELREMSYSQQIEAGEQNLLLVEGRTDIKAYRELLKLYGLEQRFILVSLGGGEFFASDPALIKEELSELSALGAKSISAIIDSERPSASAPLERRRQTFADVACGLGFDVHVLERRALENYFTAAAIQTEFGQNCQELAPYEKRGAGASWPKSGNWRVVARQSLADFSGTDLGKFVQDKLVPKASL